MAKGSAKHKINEILAPQSGKIVRTLKTCSKCGPGVFLAEHYDRFHCGKCGITQFKKKEGGVEAETGGKKTPASGRQPRARTGATPKPAPQK
jgi:small subunit ribosomal protein S27Ae